MTYKISKTDEAWKEQLTTEQFQVCRKKDTKFLMIQLFFHIKEKGKYNCLCCGAELFSSDTKFDSGSGWPSFFKSINDENIEYIKDESYGMERIEVNCKQCGSHLGHVFDDGPQPTNLRYCINSVSLDLKKS